MEKNNLPTTTSQTLGKEIQKKNLLSIVKAGELVFISDEIQLLTIEIAQQSKQFSLIKKEDGEQYLQVVISKIIKEALRFFAE